MIRRVIVATALLASLVGAGDALAAEFAVTTTEDLVDGSPGNGVCESPCSLRAAVQTANGLAGSDVIRVPAGAYDLGHVAADGAVDPAATGDLDLTDHVEIVGLGLPAVGGGDAQRIFEVPAGVAASIDGLRIRHGVAPGDIGGALLVAGDLTLVRSTVSDSVSNAGGAIALDARSVPLNAPVLPRVSINESRIENNRASRGGAIAAMGGTLLLSGSTLVGNHGTSGGAIQASGDAHVVILGARLSDNGATEGRGGGLLADASDVTVDETAFVRNTATDGGAALYAVNSASLVVRTSTLSANASETGAGAELGAAATGSLSYATVVGTALAGPFTVDNTIVSGGGCTAGVVSAGHNIDSGTSCAFAATGDMSGVDPRLAPLDENDPAPSHAFHVLLDDSPAIDHADSAPAVCFGNDQRGVPRPQGPGCDIGAYEREIGPDTSITSGPVTTNDTTPTFAFTSDAPAATFWCKIDGSDTFACDSLLTLDELAPGQHTFRVAAEAGGVTDPTPATRIFVVDLDPPASATITGGPEIDPPTRDNTPEFTFTSGEPNATFRCAIDAGPYAPCASPYTTAPLPDESYTLHVKAVDAAGNEDPSSATRVFTIDTTVPQTTISVGPSGPTAFADVEFRFKAGNESHAVSYSCRIGTEMFTACDERFVRLGMADGEYVFEVFATDRAGNVEDPPVKRTFRVDTTAPQTTITGGPDVLKPDERGTWTFAADEPAARFLCGIDQAPNFECSSPYTDVDHVLAPGPHTFRVAAVDLVGHQDLTPAERAFRIDLTGNDPPVHPELDTVILAGPLGISLDRTPHFELAANQPVLGYECRLDDGAWAQCPASYTTAELAVGDHILAARAVASDRSVDGTPAQRAFTIVEDAACADADGDALCDSWETAGVDYDRNGTVDLKLYDVDGDGHISDSEKADPRHKDVYVELDYVRTSKPSPTAIADVVAAFAHGDVANPDGEPGVRLHVQLDEQAPDDVLDVEMSKLHGGLVSAPFHDFWDVKRELWGTTAERTAGERVLAAKRFAFHYGILGRYEANAGGTGELPGNDFVVAQGPDPTVLAQEETFMHELGHNLGLHHGGGDDVNCKPNHLSTMSYARLELPLDYSRSRLPDLDETDLDEAAGIGGSAGESTFLGPNPGRLVSAAGPADYNRDGDTTDKHVRADLNGFGAVCYGPGNLLHGYDDWANLVFDFAHTEGFADQALVTIPVEPTLAQEQAARRAIYQRLRRARDVVKLPPARRCVRRLRIRARLLAGVRAVEIRLRGKRRARVPARRLPSTIRLRHLPAGRFAVQARVTLGDGRTLRAGRRYRRC
jgi:CSLREA domain-containing protein